MGSYYDGEPPGLPAPPPKPPRITMRSCLLWLLLLGLLVTFVLSLFAVEALHAGAVPPCTTTVERIVQHEVGNTGSRDMMRFVAEQVLRDLQRGYTCNSLVRLRWKIDRPAYYAYSHVTDTVREVVYEAYHTPYTFPACRFTGSPRDLRHWRKYHAYEDYRLTHGVFVVVGAGCR